MKKSPNNETAREKECVCVCMCVCVREREREREEERVRICVCECVCVGPGGGIVVSNEEPRSFFAVIGKMMPSLLNCCHLLEHCQQAVGNVFLTNW